jgi:glycosyltransferase involved in cell wall biosynthesis
MNRKCVSIISAVHNEEVTVPLFYERLIAVINGLNYDFEIIFTNNRSTDSTLDVIRKLQDKDDRIKVLTFSRNFGYQASVQAGMSHAHGDCIITIDVDCEDPPELIPEFLARWEAGYDIVYGERGNRPEPKMLVSARNLFYRILQFTADADIILNMAEFGLITSYVRDVIINNANTFPFLRTEIAYSGFNIVGIPYDREERVAGNTHYNFWRMLIFAIGGILTSSTFLLRLAAFLLPALFLINIIYFMFNDVSSYGGIIAFDLLYLTTLLTVQGIYIARIYKNGLGRPIYIVDWRLSSPELNPKSQ